MKNALIFITHLSKNIAISLADKLNLLIILKTEIINNLDTMSIHRFHEATKFLKINPIRPSLTAESITQNEIKTIAELSKAYPNYVFNIEYTFGKSSYRTYIVNNRQHTVMAELIFPPLDLDKLKGDKDEVQVVLNEALQKLYNLHEIQLKTIKDIRLEENNRVLIVTDYNDYSYCISITMDKNKHRKQQK